MTNTLYFDGIVRDDASTTSSSDISLQQLPSNDQPSSSSSLYTVIGKAITGLIPRRSGSGSAFNNNIESVGGASPAFAGITMENLVKFPYEELAEAANNFNIANKIPQGGFRAAYYEMKDGKTGRLGKLHQGSTPNDSSNDDGDFKSSAIVPSVSPPQSPSNKYEFLESGNLMVFSFEELKTATRNFHPDLVVGQGGFGLVFKGWIDPHSLTATKQGKGIAVAIRCLNSPSVQGHKEWLTETNYLGQLNHPNLVRVYGYCFDNKKRLLVFEFMPAGRLDNHLFKWGFSHLISWRHRMRIALDAANGLSFLHRADINVIHRRFRSSNILLDLNLNAKLSHIGLARGGPTDDMSLVSTIVMANDGYAAPEYLATGHLTAKCDVYSFGVVFLELLSGRRTIDHNRPPAECDLVQWAKPYLINKHKIFHVIDSHLEGQCSPQIAQKAANLALKCLAMEAKLRPNMDEVVTILEQLQAS